MTQAEKERVKTANMPLHEYITEWLDQYKHNIAILTYGAYKGMVEDTVFQLIGGLRSGMGYCGAKDIETLKETGKFVKISAASLKESHPHDIHITKEAPNYSIDE